MRFENKLYAGLGRSQLALEGILEEAHRKTARRSDGIGVSEVGHHLLFPAVQAAECPQCISR